MKKLLILLMLLLTAITVNCQNKDKVFYTLVRFNSGIQFSDGTIQTTAIAGSTSVAWSSITGKPTTLSGYGITDAAALNHNHNTLYKPLSYTPTWNEIIGKPVFSAVATTGSYNDLIDKPDSQELSSAISSLNGIIIPVRTSAQISTIIPVKGLLLWNDTDGVLQIYNGTVWKVLITNQ